MFRLRVRLREMRLYIFEKHLLVVYSFLGEFWTYVEKEK